MIIRTPVRVEEAPRVTVEKLYPTIEWEDDVTGFITCPGEALHTHPTKKRDCRIKIDGAPTIFCLHHSCKPAVDDANYELRFRMWAGRSPDDSFATRVPTPEERAILEERQAAKAEVERWKKWAQGAREKIFKRFAWDPADVYDQSPVKNEDPALDFPLFLSLFDPNDVLWIGEPTDSGEFARDHFRPACSWLNTSPAGHFTCPSAFREGTFRRSNTEVLRRPYLVIESDTLSQADTCALARWLTGCMVLRAIIYSGGKSLHCWFQTPSQPLFDRLKIVLPELGCDPALFKPSQPVRVPGIRRDGKWQSIIYFNPPRCQQK